MQSALITVEQVGATLRGLVLRRRQGGGGGPLGGGANDECEQTLNQLLVSLDSFEPNQAVIVVAATNRPDVLDPGLLRPGRFDRQVSVDPPDRHGREAILKIHTRTIPLAPGMDLAALGQDTPGMSEANLANEAALSAARKGEQAVSDRTSRRRWTASR